ncbi:MAG: hypothetical protein IPP71_08100 [Bacteroidetes bacterium]|nr:hypothetical protein [Bacteroidota bacterium]
MSVAESFRIAQDEAKIIINRVSAAVSKWHDVSGKLGLSRSEIDAMENAFL